MSGPDTIHPQLTLVALVRARPGAHGLLRLHGIALEDDAERTLAAACAASAVDATALVHQIESRQAIDTAPAAWASRPLSSLVAWLVTRFHDPLRTELPRLVATARALDARHRACADWPGDLAVTLEVFATDLEQHLRKEERVLFPLLIARGGPMAHGPIRAMESEHADHDAVRIALRRMTNGFRPPPTADADWQALYLSLASLEHDLELHARLENDHLFPRSVREGPGDVF